MVEALRCHGIAGRATTSGSLIGTVRSAVDVERSRSERFSGPQGSMPAMAGIRGSPLRAAVMLVSRTANGFDILQALYVLKIGWGQGAPRSDA